MRVKALWLPGQGGKGEEEGEKKGEEEKEGDQDQPTPGTKQNKTSGFDCYPKDPIESMVFHLVAVGVNEVSLEAVLAGKLLRPPWNAMVAIANHHRVVGLLRCVCVCGCGCARELV